jgi:hypothetical protein
MLPNNPTFTEAYATFVGALEAAEALKLGDRLVRFPLGPYLSGRILNPLQVQSAEVLPISTGVVLSDQRVFSVKR